eukprot:TRINITY_DN11151_c0_g1_i1.p1 TRINITY_DN11151_c0_g1~~TRINITY_DN11151_c0_g1_i1.p1  ORF type:complete len:197 (-),score=37.81 TRINITY_DN11151_c0_g1_i1:67-657(-)
MTVTTLLSSMTGKVEFAVGSKNKAKLGSLCDALEKLIASGSLQKMDYSVTGVTVDSGVAAQPMSDEACLKGAETRARLALQATPSASFGVGMEGGIHKIGSKWFESGWIVVLSREGTLGFGSSARFQLSQKIVDELMTGKELAEVMDEMTGETDIRSGLGAMGIVTNGCLGRKECYTHGVIFALAPFLSDAKYWTD